MKLKILIFIAVMLFFTVFLLIGKKDQKIERNKVNISEIINHIETHGQIQLKASATIDSSGVLIISVPLDSLASKW